LVGWVPLVTGTRRQAFIDSHAGTRTPERRWLAERAVKKISHVLANDASSLHHGLAMLTVIKAER